MWHQMVGAFRNAIDANASSLDAATTAWINAVVAAGGSVSATQQTRVNDLIVGLKADSLFTVLDRLWLHGGESDAKQATIDITNLGVATNHGATLSAGGYLTDGSTTFVDSGFNPNTGGTNYVLNSASIGSYGQTDWTGSGVPFGGEDGVSFSELIGTGAAGILINNASGLFTGTTGTGFYVGTRTTAASVSLYKNGSLIQTDAANISVALPNANLFILARNGNGSVDGFPAANTKTSATVISAGFNGTQMANLSTRLNTYMTAWGINTY